VHPGFYVFCCESAYFPSVDGRVIYIYIIYIIYIITDHLCGLVVRVPGYRSTGSGFDSLRYQVI
jgi:hypothetical protein